jgi:hypothetical protein
MIRVHVWNYRGLKTAMGHASMHVEGEYISWWPAGENRRFKAGSLLPLYSVDHIHGQSFEDDQLLEALDENSEWDAARGAWIDLSTGKAVVPLAPHHNIPLNGLDEPRILAWWGKFNAPGRDWSTLGQNCATTVGRALMMGGGDDYSLGAKGWWHSWNMVWQPNDVHKYAVQIQRGLAGKDGEHAAINFVRRFCKSPLGFTSITSKMNEKGLAEAIYRELGGDTALVRGVFQQLKSRRNTDADDVAEIYVNLLRTGKGAPMAAVAKDERLKRLLIQVLEEGWTSSSERSCIDFLKSLA